MDALGIQILLHMQQTILKFARDNGCPWDEDTCANAARNGHFDILKVARENGCPWDSITCANAARNEHYEILKFALENGCPWNSNTCGYLDIIKFAREWVSLGLI